MKKRNILTSLFALTLLATGLANQKTTTVSAKINTSDFSYQKYLKEIRTYTYNEAGEKVLSSTKEYTNDDNGNPITLIVSSVDTETGNKTPTTKQEMTYDEKDRMLSRTTSSYSAETEEYTTANEYTWTYNDAGSILTQTMYKFDNNVKNAEPTDTYTYKYDANNNIIEDTRVGTYGNSKNTYEYNEKNLLTKQFYYIGENLDTLSQKYEYEYDANNNILIGKKFTYEGSAVFGSYKFEYTYENNKLTEYLETSYIDTTEAQENAFSYSKREYSYDGDEVTYIYSTKKATEENFTVQFKYVEIDTDTEYKFVSYRPNEYDERGWTYDSATRFTLTYDDSRVSSYTTYDYVGTTDSWKEKTFTEYEYVKNAPAPTPDPDPEDDPEPTPTNKKKFPYWIIPTGSTVLLLGAYTCGYFFFYDKGKLSGKFFDTIYTWFRNLLAKLPKKNK